MNEDVQAAIFAAVQKGRFQAHTWTVRMNNQENEGRSVWENCPVEVGRNVFLYVMDMPPFCVRIGPNRYRLSEQNRPINPLEPPISGANLQPDYDIPTPFLNMPVIAVGPWPAPYYPLGVGCELDVLPAIEVNAEDNTGFLYPLGDEPGAPEFGQLNGFDIRSLSAHGPNVKISAWLATEVTADPGNISNVFLYLRHPSGVWGRVGTILDTYTPGNQIRTRATPVAGADRVAVTFTRGGGSPSGGVRVAYSCITSSQSIIPFVPGKGTLGPKPLEQPHIRFGAVECPEYMQPPPELLKELQRRHKRK